MVTQMCCIPFLFTKHGNPDVLHSISLYQAWLPRCAAFHFSLPSRVTQVWCIPFLFTKQGNSGVMHSITLPSTVTQVLCIPFLYQAGQLMCDAFHFSSSNCEWREMKCNTPGLLMMGLLSIVLTLLYLLKMTHIHNKWTSSCGFETWSRFQ